MNKSQTLFNTLLNEWLETKQDTIRQSTFCKYEQLIRLHIRPYFRTITCGKITQKMLQEYYDKISLKNDAECSIAIGTLRCLCMIINSALRMGQEYGYMKNLFRLTPRLSREYHLVQVFSKENQALLEQYLYDHPSQNSCGVLLALYSGIRIGELCSLTFEDLDLINGYVKIVRTVQRTTIRTSQQNEKQKKTELVISAPKSRSAYRLVPLPDFLVQYLNQYLNFSESHHYIFSKSGKTPLDPRSMQYFYKKILKEIQIPYLNFHCLRHTFATRCITLGWDVRTLSEVLGHADIKVTMEYYFHSSMEYKKMQMQKFEPFIQHVR